MAEGPSPEYMAHWKDQFAALVRDKIAALIDAGAISELDPLTHHFSDPSDGDVWQVTYADGEYYLKNVEWDGPAILVDPIKLGVQHVSR